MNQFAGFAHPVLTGYHAMIRLARDGQAKPVLGKSGHPIVYATEAEAWRAVATHLLAYFNGHLRREGETIAACQGEAEKVFAGLGSRRPE